MALKAVLESLDDVQEATRDYYEEKDGKFVLSLEGIDDHPAVANLRSALERQKADRKKAADERDALKAKYDGVPEDFSADEWARLKAMDEAGEGDEGSKDVRQKVEDATNRLKARYEAQAAADKKRLENEIAQRDERIATLDSQIRKRLVDDGLTRALAEAGVTKAPLLKAAKALLAPEVEVLDDEGEYTARMKPDLGGDDLMKFVQNWVQTDDGKAFVEPARGGDALGSKSARGGEANNPFGKATWNKTEQGRLYNGDRVKAERLARSAGFSDLNSAIKASAPVAA